VFNDCGAIGAANKFFSRPGDVCFVFPLVPEVRDEKLLHEVAQAQAARDPIRLCKVNTIAVAKRPEAVEGQTAVARRCCNSLYAVAPGSVVHSLVIKLMCWPICERWLERTRVTLLTRPLVWHAPSASKTRAVCNGASHRGRGACVCVCRPGDEGGRRMDSAIGIPLCASQHAACSASRAPRVGGAL
jgi:hypothetical protein